jgi:uncharacterized protein involved in response to NO
LAGAAATAAAPAGFPSLAELPQLLAAAPHRLMFLAGATAVLTSMLWWACSLGAGYFGHAFPTPPVPAGWAHAVLTQYGMLSMFIFGFLLTVFPRWMGQPALSRRVYVPVFAGVFGGYLLTHLGLLDHKPLLFAGLSLMFTGWVAALIALGQVLTRNGWRDRHALSCFVALTLGGLGLLAFLAFALGASWGYAFWAMKLGTFGLLLPVYFTVCHRMIPFFSASAATPDYEPWKPAWSLPVLWPLLIAHLAGELEHRFDLLWIVDLPLAVFFLVHWLGWQPWKCMKPGLLAALHLAFAWLPIAFVLFGAQSVVYALTGEFVLGRAPVHALTIGFFGSMLVAMVTRVTQGHSGRPLTMGAIPWLTFALLQVVALTRIGAELATNTAPWLVVAAFGWLLAFAPWVIRSLWIYLTPRIDGRPG